MQAPPPFLLFPLLASLVFIFVARTTLAHSWIACSDYRGDVNYFEQSRCYGYPRGYRPVIDRELGYQIAYPDSRAFSGGGCDIPKAEPWNRGYTSDFPHAVYEPGETYCVVWPMKNHGWLPETGCEGFQQSKSDAGIDGTIHLYISSANPARDPTQQEFEARNLNELLGLASRCDPGLQNSNAKSAECQLGLERTENYARDCKGFQRSPKFCESSGEAMGHGCFTVPSDLEPGHYVGQWYWRTSFLREGSPNGLQTIPYFSCFDFEVSAGAPQHPDTPGVKGEPDSLLPCTNNYRTVLSAAPSALSSCE